MESWLPSQSLFNGKGTLSPIPSPYNQKPPMPAPTDKSCTNHNPPTSPDSHLTLPGPTAPHSCHTSLRRLFFLLLFSPEELSSLDTNSLLLKLSLSCLDADLDDEPLEGVDFFSIFTFTFFFFFDLSLY